MNEWMSDSWTWQMLPWKAETQISMCYTSVDSFIIINERIYLFIYLFLYHSYQDCPIDFHIRQSVPFHDHDIVPPTISWPVRYASVLSHNTHESYVCRAKCRVCGTVKSEVGQWIRINIGRARLKRNLDLISVFHCHCPRAQLLAAHTAAHQS